jgi:hypothetical protein
LGQVRVQDAQPYMGRNGPAGMRIASTSCLSSGLISGRSGEAAMRASWGVARNSCTPKLKTPAGGGRGFREGRARGKIRSSGKYLTASRNDRRG